jgi:hypothetical protein
MPKALGLDRQCWDSNPGVPDCRAWALTVVLRLVVW